MNKGIIALSLAIVFLCSPGYSAEKSPSGQVQDSEIGLLIKKRITAWRASSQKVACGESIYASVLVGNFYKARDYQPAWRRDGRLTEAEKLIRAVEEAYGDGLMPDYYHLGIIKSLVGKKEKGPFPDPAGLADLDILLTDAFLTLGCHLSGGCVNPVTIKAEWYAKRGNINVSSVLEQAIRKGQVREALTRLRPTQASYERLRQALSLYRELSLKGDWPQVSNGPALKINTVSGRVLELRKRLAASNDLDVDGAGGGDLFDEKLKQAVMTFQKRHGLKADGVVGTATRDAFNVPLKERLRQIELNMERLRWVLGNEERRSIIVNIANFGLDVVENGKSVLSMKVVVGKRFWNTPVFTAKMTYLIINPSWNVPESIAVKEMLESIREDPRYLVKNNIKVSSGLGAREKEIDPETVDWSKVTAGTLIYRFRQTPGPLNSLGVLKFMFPNRFNVYLHDTPAKGLFSKDVRTFSHGCTRIEKPLELAEYVLRDDPRWTREKILAEINKGTEQKVPILRPINVHFLYLTAWVDEEGVLQFRDDIYGRDKSLDSALRDKPSLR